MKLIVPEIVDPDPVMLEKRKLHTSRLGGNERKPDNLKKHNRSTTSGTGPTLFDLGLTIVHPYYNDETRLPIQFENWKKYSDKVKASLHIVIADDCSKTPASNLMDRTLGIDIQVFRVLKDLRHNTPGALNLGVLNAPTDWVLIMDSDCVLEPNMIERLMSYSPDKIWFHYFNRKRITNDKRLRRNTRYLPCAVLFHKECFKIVGGFDEDFTGERSKGYGSFDTTFEFVIVRYGYLRALMNDVIITEHMQDSIGPNVQTKTGTNYKHHRINIELYDRKICGEAPMNRKWLNFPWEKQ
ncbi:MAG: glycosyltransferase family 2 protein [Nitrososphaera sp.]|nr:glycosyltransferase family 2 protein [Nitrososphaera sp.]